jgi:glutathione-regulated potassium-efflux system ancillary protein KefG
MAKLLLLFAYPALEKLRVHATLLKRVQQISDTTITDLYQQYSFFDVDIHREQAPLLAHDIFVFKLIECSNIT